MRIGHGYDVHRFGEGDHITLGGVRIPHRFGLLAHSDGDVLLHALSDALLGPLRWAISASTSRTPTRNGGADSRALLRHVLVQVQAKGYVVGNVDATIIAQAPKMAPHIDSMRALIAADLQVELDQVNVKATTTEKLGFTGVRRGSPFTRLPCWSAHDRDQLLGPRAHGEPCGSAC
ncbi:2-C-methyl-D-erythritol 2,4-cyclodiphosphate synthase [Stutzerimonas xanthomarina]|uniref:2-C-methyl-D-erythritol 2,4-cyclodiphosphate synthase n=1 Tax=Stutzerimonas xanthomarina TaxID=271420 RepID=UPI003AA827C4